ncbi:serine/threonine-protein phosphatase 2A activator [Anabrus simplex]|uniref:serine/threonine-protein phosphatase 2A activator n=1 Tax=Anabrus simplex TaxID=316456 RepID=UPI0035A316A4
MESVVPEDHEYVIPRKEVTSMEDMQMWEKSEAYKEYVGFLLALNEAVQGKPLSGICPVTDITTGMLSLLDKLDQWIDETPPMEQPQRFGNQAFRKWYAKLKEGALDLLQSALPEKFYPAIPEIMVYLVEGFGNATRIDYGTGHEMSFLMLLCCLFKIGAFVESDKVAVVCQVFNRYLNLVRKLQLTYRMEPAGSHGVWSLDDYQFVPFIWGSSQLIDHPRIEPKSFLQPDVVESFSKEYMFIGCIEFINKVKTGLFAEHSNQLWNISGVNSWTKVNSGLIKMYKAEILAKFPVIQHVLFGSLLPFKVAESNRPIMPLRMNMASRTSGGFVRPGAPS